MNRLNPLLVAIAALASFAAVAAPAAPGNDIPTAERVEYVLECMRANPGPRQEMLYKCSCTLDELAKYYNHEQFVDGSTLANALSIGGERGAVLRDSESAKELAGSFRATVSKARKACFLN